MFGNRVVFDEIICDLREKLRLEFQDEGQNFARAYRPESGERDSQDHQTYDRYALVALSVARPLIQELVDAGLGSYAHQ